jgi:hypothetical protein
MTTDPVVMAIVVCILRIYWLVKAMKTANADKKQMRYQAFIREP